MQIHQRRSRDRKRDYFWAAEFHLSEREKSLYIKYLPNKIVIVIIAWWIFMKTMLLFVIKVAISFVAYGAEASIASTLRKGLFFASRWLWALNYTWFKDDNLIILIAKSDTWKIHSWAIVITSHEEILKILIFFSLIWINLNWWASPTLCCCSHANLLMHFFKFMQFFLISLSLLLLLFLPIDYKIATSISYIL